MQVALPFSAGACARVETDQAAGKTASGTFDRLSPRPVTSVTQAFEDVLYCGNCLAKS